jgi:NitT/TauT family transport system permease protein
VIVHAVLWPLALGAYAGFQAVPETLRMAGRNYGLTGLRPVLHILVPAALPSILSGLKIGWAFAWRTLIAAELVFGTTAAKALAGTFSRTATSCTPKGFAGLAAVILIGCWWKRGFPSTGPADRPALGHATLRQGWQNLCVVP